MYVSFVLLLIQDKMVKTLIIQKLYVIVVLKLILGLNKLLVYFTGDVAFRILDSINSVKRQALQDSSEDNLLEETQIYVCDINPSMLNVGKKRAQERGKKIHVKQTAFGTQANAF